MRHRYYAGLGLILALAAVLTLFKVPLASSQGLTLVAAEVTGDLPTADPSAAAWQTATAVDVPLSAQNVTRPMLLETRIKSVTARALYNTSQLAVLVTWQDDTQNASMVRVQDFRDAVAVQFPLVDGQPFFCMGQAGGNVNIWHWKADWQADIAARQDMETLYPNMYTDMYPFAAGDLPAPADYTDVNYVPALAANNLFAAVHPSPVEDIIAGGFGTLTAQDAAAQNVQGYGAWQDGTWRVIFVRDLASAETNDVQFAAGKAYFMALAAWDGANNERNGQKSTSQWLTLQLGAASGPSTTPIDKPQEPLDPSPIIFMGGGMLLAALAILGIAAGAITLAELAKRQK